MTAPRMTGRVAARPLRAASWAVVISAVVAIAGCASSKPKPLPLEPLTPKIAGALAWSQRIEKVEFPLTVAVTRSAFVVAGHRPPCCRTDRPPA